MIGDKSATNDDRLANLATPQPLHQFLLANVQLGADLVEAVRAVEELEESRVEELVVWNGTNGASPLPIWRRVVGVTVVGMGMIVMVGAASIE